METTRSEKGSAMVIAVLVMAIMSLLGISYLLMADTENKIAENEKLASQALYFGEGSVREVKRWFDRPPYGVQGGKNLVKPLTTVMDRTLRQIDPDGDGPTAAVAADGSIALPYYKVGIDRDADGNDDIFEKPYRSALADMLVGTETGPDIRIDRNANTATATFLDGMRDKIAPNFPAGTAGIQARIKTIDVYAPPYLSIGGTWTRYGMATVKATVEIVRVAGSSTQVIASRVIKAVLNETPFPGPFGPLHSCEEMNFNGEFRPHWGTSTAIGNLTIGVGANNKIPLSLPRAVPPSAKIDLLHGHDDNAVWTGMYGAGGTMLGLAIDDPWYRFILDGTCNQWVPATSTQPYPPGTTAQDQSNKIQLFGGVGCPDFEYDTWKQIAQSGGSDVHYYAWDNGQDYRENGVGAATDWKVLTDGKQGLFFFDTTDGIAPHDPDANGVAANLTPEMSISANYGVQGFVYANTSNWTSQGTPGRPITMHWPNEPYRDANQNGRYDAGEDWVNLNYSTISTTDPTVKPVISSASTGDAYGGAPMYNAKGPDITGQVGIVWGLLYVSGNFDSQGTPLYYGSVVTKAGMNGSMVGTPDLWWDTDLKDNWPPPGWELPRVIITKWETDL
jgi:hypothetical protein